MRLYLEEVQMEREKIEELEATATKRHNMEERASNLHHLLSTKVLNVVIF
jgi:hypothetical protein